MSAKILLVDDENSANRLISQAFSSQIQEEKYSFYYAGDGEEAWEQIQLLPPDLLLLDLRLPRLDGFSLLHRLNESKLTFKTIIISAYGTFNNYRQALREGAFDFLVKPIDLKELQKTVEEALQQPKKNNKSKDLLREKPTQLDKSKTHFLTVLRLARELPPSQQYKLTSALIENFSLDQLDTLQNDIPDLRVIVKKEEAARKKAQQEDEERIKQGLIPVSVLKEGYVELRKQPYTKKYTGEKVYYTYFYLRWLDPQTNRLRGRNINQKDLADPITRHYLEKKLDQPLDSFNL